MKKLAAFLVILTPLFMTSLAAQSVHFAAQADLVADLSDSVLGDIYFHRLTCCDCACQVDQDCCQKNAWLQGFGSYRERRRSHTQGIDRDQYENTLGGVLAGFSTAVSDDAALNLFVGGSWGDIDPRSNERDFDTDSFLLGFSLEQLYCNQFVGFAFAAGVLEQKHNRSDRLDKAQGVFITPELTYATGFGWGRCCPILTSTLRYAGFFPSDYQVLELVGPLRIRNYNVQLLTIREEIAIPTCLSPYIGVAGRFQLSGRKIESKLVLDHYRFDSGIENSIGYGFIGLRGSLDYNRFSLQGNIEGSYDTDRSARVLGQLTLNFAF